MFNILGLILIFLFSLDVLSLNNYYYIKKINLNRILDKIDNVSLKKEILKEIEDGENQRKLEEHIKNTNDAFKKLKEDINN